MPLVALLQNFPQRGSVVSRSVVVCELDTFRARVNERWSPSADRVKNDALQVMALPTEGRVSVHNHPPHPAFPRPSWKLPGPLFPKDDDLCLDVGTMWALPGVRETTETRELTAG